MSTRGKKRKRQEKDDLALEEDGGDAPVKKRIRTKAIYRRLDNRTFVNNGKRNGVRYWRCNSGCGATAKSKIVPPGEPFVMTRLNKHSKVCFEDDKQDVILMRDFMENKLKNANKWLKLEHVYNEGAKAYPKGALLLTFFQIQSTLKSWRWYKFPRCPMTLKQLAEQLQDGHYNCLLHRENVTVEWALVTDAKKNIHIVFFNRQLILEFLQRIKRMFIDATFQTRAKLKDCMQLLTVLVVYMAKAVCIFYALMSRRTTDAYIAVLSHLRSICGFEQLQVIMADFERPLRTGASIVFPGVLIAGCNVHLDRALYSHLRPIQSHIEKNEAVAYYVKAIMVLAFLRADMIVPQFNRLVADMSDEVKEVLEPFLTYYDHQWLQSVTPEGFSVFGLENRTNNCAEVFNSELLRLLGTKPVACEFLYGLGQAFEKTLRKVGQVQNMRFSELPAFQSMYRDHQLKRAWSQLQHGKIEPEEFIDMAITLKGDLTGRMDVALLEQQYASGEIEYESTVTIAGLDKDPDFDRTIVIDPAVLRAQQQAERAQKRQERETQNEDSDTPHIYRNTRKPRCPGRHETPSPTRQGFEGEDENDDIDVSLLTPEVSCTVDDIDRVTEESKFKYDVVSGEPSIDHPIGAYPEESREYFLYYRLNGDQIFKLTKLCGRTYVALLKLGHYGYHFANRYLLRSNESLEKLEVSWELVDWKELTYNCLDDPSKFVANKENASRLAEMGECEWEHVEAGDVDKLTKQRTTFYVYLEMAGYVDGYPTERFHIRVTGLTQVEYERFLYDSTFVHRYCRENHMQDCNRTASINISRDLIHWDPVEFYEPDDDRYPIYEELPSPDWGHDVRDSGEEKISQEVAESMPSEQTLPQSCDFDNVSTHSDTDSCRLEGNEKDDGKIKSNRTGLQFPVAAVHASLKGNYAKHVKKQASIFLAATLEFLTAEVLEVSGMAANVASKRRHITNARIVPRHIKLALDEDADLKALVSIITTNRDDKPALELSHDSVNPAAKKRKEQPVPQADAAEPLITTQCSHDKDKTKKVKKKLTKQKELPNKNETERDDLVSSADKLPAPVSENGADKHSTSPIQRPGGYKKFKRKSKKRRLKEKEGEAGKADTKKTDSTRNPDKEDENDKSSSTKKKMKKKKKKKVKHNEE